MPILVGTALRMPLSNLQRSLVAFEYFAGFQHSLNETVRPLRNAPAVGSE